LADSLDRILGQYGLIQVVNPGSVSWKLPPDHHMAGVAGAELTFEVGGRTSFGFNEALAQHKPQLAGSGLFERAFRVIPVRPGTASFVDFRLNSDSDQRCRDLTRMCDLLGFSREEGDDDSFSATLQSL
jgi:hypothetical protein